MANLLCITVTLIFLLSAGCVAEVDKNKLRDLILQIKKPSENGIKGIYAAAVSVPKDDPYNLPKEYQLKQENIKQIKKGVVYNNGRQAFAIKLIHKPEHAELRVLTDLNLVNDEGDMLVIFSRDSPCPENCAMPGGEYNILDKIKDVIAKGKWGDHVLVFENVFKPKNEEKIDESELKTALNNIGESIGGLANVFRCYTPKNTRDFQCVSCSSKDGQVTAECTDYGA